MISMIFYLQVKQKDIESHSRIVSAVLKHCETLQDNDDVFDHEERRDSLEFSAHKLERHWHEIWLQSLEWQCRLEDAISSGKVRSHTRISTIFTKGNKFCAFLFGYLEDKALLGVFLKEIII